MSCRWKHGVTIVVAKGWQAWYEIYRYRYADSFIRVTLCHFVRVASVCNGEWKRSVINRVFYSLKCISANYFLIGSIGVTVIARKYCLLRMLEINNDSSIVEKTPRSSHRRIVQILCTKRFRVCFSFVFVTYWNLLDLFLVKKSIPVNILCVSVCDDLRATVNIVIAHSFAQDCLYSAV